MQQRLANTLAISFALALGSSVAYAQDGEILEEITVTAEKREASIQDVPISISAITGDTIEDMAIDDVMDLYVQTPGISFSRAGGEAQVYIRGIGTDAFGVTIDPSVAIHMDGVYLGRPQMGLTQFLDVERVEILKGPQGTLYGRNATGGAINVISRKPSADRDGYLTLGIGSWQRQELKAATNVGLGNSWNARFAGRFLADDGFTDDVEAGGSDEIDDQNLRTLRATFASDSGGRVDATIIADYTKFKSGNRSSKPLDGLSFAVVNGAEPQEFDETRNNLSTYHDWDTSGLTVTIDFELSDAVSLTSVTGWRDYTSDFFFNTDGTEIEVTRSYFAYESEQLSQELRLSSTTDNALSWMVGAYYMDEDKEGALGLGRNTHPFFGQVSFIIPNVDETEAFALFGELNYQFSDTLAGTLGVRYSDEEKTDFTSVGAIFGDFTGLESGGNIVQFFTRSETKSWDDVSPRVVLTYTPDDDTMIYGSVTQGFKSGGWNAFDGSPAFDPEEVTSFEVGIKTDLMDGKVRLNASVFSYDYKDLQVSTFQNGLTVTTNAADAEVWGAEIEVWARPSDNFLLNASLGYLSAEYQDFQSAYGRCPADATPAELAGGCMGVGAGQTRVVQLKGNTLQNAPEFKANVNGTYTIDLSGGARVDVFAQLAHQSELFHTQFNDALIGQDDVTLLDARVAWTSADDQYTLALYGKNLTDEEYFQNTVRFTSLSEGNPADRYNIGAGLGYPAPGMSWGIEGTLRF
jgi:iron complex outermembrane receptor protein